VKEDSSFIYTFLYLAKLLNSFRFFDQGENEIYGNTKKKSMQRHNVILKLHLQITDRLQFCGFPRKYTG